MLGNAAVGLVAGTYGALEVASLLCWTRLVQRESVGRRTAFAVAIVVEVCSLSSLLLEQVSMNIETRN